MNQLPFTFSNALMHMTKTGGPKGFIWKFALAYGVAVVFLYLLMMWSFAPIFSVAWSGDIVDEDAMDAAVLGNLGRIFGGYLLSLVGGLLVWVVFEAASQRRYMRGEGFHLRLGADEGRLFVVGLIFSGIFIASYIALFVLMGVFVGGQISAAGEGNGAAAGILIFAVMLIYLVGLMFIMVRLSPAASLTIRDRAIRFPSAWRVSRGKGWVIFGSWILLYIATYFALFIVSLVLTAIAFAAFLPAISNMQGNGEDPAEVMRLLSSPGVLAGGIFAVLLITSVIGVFIHAFGGPAALAAKNDPEWVDQEGINETFA